MKTLSTSGLYHDDPAFPLIKFAQATQGLVYSGRVTAVPGANQFTISELAGFGAGIFADATAPYYAFVQRDAGGLSAAPQGEIQAITAYVTATGAFTTAAFTAAVGIGDEILIVSYPIAMIFALSASGGRQLFTFDSWSIPQITVTVPAVAADLALPDVVIANLPAGATPVKAIGLFKYRVVANTNAAANKLSGAQYIQIRLAAGVYTNCIQFVDDQFSIAASTREGGDVSIGDINVAATVTGNGTYNFQWDEAVADLASIVFYDVQTGIRIWYSV